MTVVEKSVAVMQADIATIRSNYATREDVAELKATLFQAMEAQTWRIVTWMSAVLVVSFAGVYFIARNVY